jgi:N-acetylated-alpha-linked acidic dipeptidase
MSSASDGIALRYNRSRPMSFFRCVLIVGFLVAPASAQSILGFTPASAAHETAIEEKFKSIPSPDEERRQHRIFTAEPHVAGSKRNNDLADYIASEWKKQGLEDVVLRRYDVYGTNPKSASLEMIAPVRYTATLREAPIPGDDDSVNSAISGAWLGMSISGEVTAPVVYAHSGNPEDYDLLRKSGISVKGKIVLVRYSNPYSYRGFKALTAQREGAAAMLVYSDPQEDGYEKGKVDPEGPWGPEYHIQRGAITYDFMVPGDPQTPGWASVPGAKRIPIEDAISAPKIMALPLSWHDAKPLLENLDGPVAPANWQGGLGFSYHFGGGIEKLHLKIEMQNGLQPYFVVEGRIRGSELADEWIVLGNHRDAWVFGGVDPSSGTASMMELTRALGDLAKNGMRPRRTIIVCSWDGEEVGLTGSTEWGEQFADELRAKAVAYINVDEATSGPNFHGQAVASLAPMLEETTRTLNDPSGKTLYDAWKETIEKEKESARSGPFDSGASNSTLADTRIGSGSDHTVFLNFVGVPVLGLGFEGDYGVYHSAYDDFFWMNHFGDPGYRYHTLMSQLWGVTALRLANADLLPFDFAIYAANIRQFVNELAKNNSAARSDQHPAVILSEVRSNERAESKDPAPSRTPAASATSYRETDLTVSRNVIPSGGEAGAKDLTTGSAVRDASERASSSLDLTGILKAIDAFEAAGKQFNDSLTRKLASGKIDPKLALTLNHGMMQVERNWLNPDGIPGRPWFKHILYGARFNYAHLELPALTEAVEKQDWRTATEQASILQRALEKNTELLHQLNEDVAASPVE